LEGALILGAPTLSTDGLALGASPAVVGLLDGCNEVTPLLGQTLGCPALLGALLADGTSLRTLLGTTEIGGLLLDKVVAWLG